MTFKHRFTLAAFALSAALPVALVPSLAQAAPRAGNHVASSVKVESFTVDPVSDVGPGSELEFTLVGSPGAAVQLQIAGVQKPVPLAEVRPGRYEGSYTVRTNDRLGAGSRVTARLAKGGHVATASLGQPLLAGAQGPADASPDIATFRVEAPDGISPGDELHLSMTGAPGGKASANLKGVANRIALTEVRRGVYDGSYTVRRSDRLDEALSATGSLVLQNHESTQRFERGSSGHAAAACGHCGVVEVVNVVEVQGGQKNVIGTLAGGVLGGVLGHQVGDGSGRDLATIAGAVGGAYAGNRTQNAVNKTVEYQVVVRLENGTQQTFTYPTDPAIQAGTRVKVENDKLLRL